MAPTMNPKAIAAVVLCIIGTSTCRQPDSVQEAKLGAIEGDVFLLMSSGDKKEGAGLAVYLLEDTPHLVSMISGACSASVARVIERKRALEETKEAISAYLDELPKKEADAREAKRSAKSDDEWERADERWEAAYDELQRSVPPLVLQERRQTALAALVAESENLSASVESILAQSITDSAKADIDAHYAFLDVKPGRYHLWTDWQIGGNQYHWLVAVQVEPGQDQRQDLDNVVEGVPWNVLLTLLQSEIVQGAEAESLLAAGELCSGNGDRLREVPTRSVS